MTISSSVPSRRVAESNPRATLAPQQVADSATAPRIDALDSAKGALILFMVAYHAINYSAFRPLAFQYLAFLPPSFILISGFLVGQVYAVKYDLGAWKPYGRLLTRGLKLFAIFAVLNVALCMAREKGFIDGLWEFSDRSRAILISGNGRLAIFEVLLPISYFLLLAPLLLWLRNRAHHGVAFFAAFLFLACVVLERRDASFYNLTLLSAGIVGMSLGLIPIGTIDSFASKRLPVVLLYCAYRAAAHFFGETYPIQMLGAIASVLLLYCCGLRLPRDSWLSRQLATLGKYSLVGYLVQIAILQVMVVIAGLPGRWFEVLAAGSTTAVLLFLAVQAVDGARRKSPRADRLYKAVFG